MVAIKIARQQKYLYQLCRTRPELRSSFSHATTALVGAQNQLSRGMLSSLASIRGVEGQAALVCFGIWGQLFAPALCFTGRKRRPPPDPVNACLSLAYTLLHFEAVRCIYSCGLDPFIGFYHHPVFARESLACDLIEPLRPMVDMWVYELFHQETLRPEHFSNNQNNALLGKAGREHFYQAWAEVQPIHMRYLMWHCKKLTGWLQRHSEKDINRLAEVHNEDMAAFYASPA